ncbi:MAG: hypothetical protein J0L84_16010 [Verrucomicrobia bacterium]|nr:hypothetical protein [Verrucomicrobiota bacterium]
MHSRIRAGMLMACLAVSGSSEMDARAAVAVATTNHLGWSDAWVVSNGQVEAVVVPAVGRVMQFRWCGATQGPFWENPQLAGKPMPEAPWTASHGSFGGDKTWPAPQSLWSWPPPDVFDAAAVEARVEDGALRLISGVSPRFGIRTERRVVVPTGGSSMAIETTYHKVSGDPVTVGVWVITQMADPVAVYVPVPKGSRFASGTSALWGASPPAVSRQGDLLRLTRDTANSYKVGNDGTAMLWVGATELLRIDIPRVAGGAYADDGCSVEVYSNPDPVPYMELETLGVQRRLAAGDTVSATNTYTLFRRQSADEAAEVRRALAPGGAATP